MHETTVLTKMDNLCLNHVNLDVSSNLILGKKLFNRHHTCDDVAMPRRIHQILQPLPSPNCVGQLTDTPSLEQKQTVSVARILTIMNEGTLECS